MISSSRTTNLDGAVQAFGEQLDAFASGQLMTLTQYFSQDLIYVIENDITLVLQELITGRVITSQEAQMYAQLEKSTDSTKGAKKMVEDLFRKTKEVAVGFWKCLYSLRSKWSHPNLNRMVEELSCHGQELLEEVLLNRDGHLLDQELKGSQEKLKESLHAQTETLSRSTRGAQFEGRRFPIQNYYVELKVVSDAHFRRKKMCEHEALAAVGEVNEYRLRHKVQADLERITPDRLFRWCSRSHRTPHSVMVSGVAGVGKTTFVQKFVYDWATGKHYQKFTFVFFFKFRDLNSLKQTSLEALLQTEYPQLHSHLGAILQDPEKLLFIFDGLDESKSVLDLCNDQSPEFCVLPGDVKPVNVIVASLLKETLLKGCSILLTSRPTKLAHLEMAVFHRVASIVGFLAQDREQYFHNFFGDVKIAQKALTHVRDSQVLYTLCYNPSYCWITCTALQAYFTSNSGQRHPLPQTVTQLFVSYMKHMMDHHSGDFTGGPSVEELLVQLGFLADHCLRTGMLVFDEHDLEAFQVAPRTWPSLFTAFVVEDVQAGISSLQVTYSFLHLTIQEFFAALFHYLDFKDSHFSNTIGLAQSNRTGDYDIFFRFLSGLSHQNTRAPLEEILGKFSAVASERVIGWLKKKNWKALLRDTTQSGKRKAMNFFNILFEAQNGQLVQQLMGDSARVDFSDLYLMSVDCTILAYVLSHCQTVELLNLNSCYIQNEGLEKLSPHLHVIQDLSLQDNYLKDSAVKHLVSALKHPQCQLKSLSLAWNRLTRNCCEVLCSALSENKSVLNLDLSKTKLRDDGLSVLLKVFQNPDCKIQKLMIQENGLSEASCKLLRSALAGNTSLVSLNLSSNPLTDRCVPELRQLIQERHSLQEIRLNLTDISPQMEEQLKNMASQRDLRS
ncbi:NACHT, LRR and PYD domains-containing protein 3-like [Python bivittatus]|uniref:NACHT, LRR and PYD domains-containing protein 3-like n=1 Tax=Python bivittatus TaxID=176946 RepID=A0A9F2R675_PYTBI|nr:NACHT, LRR and PYD domains-containing protein 3-like [Python bivittatus]XP_025028657.1 NACHT, LRR and PYD domains-containing protein 3-like [Python bivittatus]